MADEKDFQIKLVASADMRAAKDAARALQEVRKETGQEAKETQDSAKSSERLALKKNELRAAVKGLSLEFPVLGRLAALALNPISLFVAGAASAWGIWTRRIKEATDALGGFEMPDVSGSKLEGIRQATEAWGKYAEAVGNAVRQYGEAEAASQRAMAKVKEETAQRLEQIKLMKELEAARLETEKVGLSQEEYARRKSALEADTRADEAGVKWQGQQDEWYVKNERVATLRQEAAEKEAAARRIRVGQEGDYAGVEKGYRESAERAVEVQRKSNAWLGRIAQFRAREGSPFAQSGIGLAMIARYGHTATTEAGMEAAAALERENIARAQPAIDAYRKFQTAQRHRALARERRTSLLGEAGQAGAAAAVGDLELGEEAGALSGGHARDILAGQVRDLTASYRDLAGELQTGAQQEKDLRMKVAQAFESRGLVNQELLSALDAVIRQNAENATRLRNLQGQTSHLRNP